MNILVTGGRGFLGKFLCVALKKKGWQVTAPPSSLCDLTDSASLDSFKRETYDVIFHLAAWTQAGDFCLKHPAEQWIINQKLNTNVLDFWIKHQRQAKLVGIGTSCSYSPDLPLKEEYYLQGQPINSLFTYGYTKRMLLAGLMAANRQYGLSYLYAVPSTLYGPEYHTDGRQMHFIFDLIRKIIAGNAQGTAVELWGDGHQTREIIHVNDFVGILLRLTEENHTGIINIGAGQEYSIRTFASMISGHLAYDTRKIVYDQSKYTGARSKCLNTDKLRGLYPDLRLVPLQDGLRDTISWFNRFMYGTKTTGFSGEDVRL